MVGRKRVPVPHLRFEKALWAEGKRHVVGVDEVGLGSWAGPVTVGAVVLDPARRVYKVRDSKLLDADTRERLAPRIQKTCVAWSVGHAQVEEIDGHGLSEARRRAARRALRSLAVDPDACLLDGNWDYTGLGERTTTIIDGDQQSLSIACASVVAKVARDRRMTELARDYPAYQWHSNKGYPSPSHKAALAREGPCPLHRRLFTPIAALYQMSLFAPFEGESMGQPMEVSVKETLDRHVRVFETNRWLTGMGSGLFEATDRAPEGSMARMILETGQVAAVHVYGNILTVTRKPDADWDELSGHLQERLENFLIYYPENIGKKVDFSAALGEAAGDDPDSASEEETS